MEQQSGFSLRDIAHVLFKRKWLIALFFLATILSAGTLVALLTQTMYSAQSQILLQPGREHVSDPALSSAGPLQPRVNFDLEEQAARTIAILTGLQLSEQLVQRMGARRLCYETPSVLPRAEPFCDPGLSDDELSERVASLVQAHIVAERIGMSALIHLSFLHPDPEIAADAVNRLGALYLERHLDVLRNPRNESFLQEQFGVLSQRLSSANEALDRFKAREGISSALKDEHQSALVQLNTLQSELVEARSREAELRSQVAALGAQHGEIHSSPEAIAAVRNRLIHLERRRSGTGDDQAGLEREIERTRSTLLRLEDRKTKEGVVQDRVQEDLLRSQAELDAARARVRALQPKMAELQARVAHLDRIAPEFNRLQQRVELEQQNHHLYMSKAEEARIVNAMDNERIASVKVIESARVPTQPVDSRTPLKLLLALVFGAAGGVVLAFILELFSDRLETADRTEHVLGVPVLATIPQMRA